MRIRTVAFSHLSHSGLGWWDNGRVGVGRDGVRVLINQGTTTARLFGRINRQCHGKSRVYGQGGKMLRKMGFGSKGLEEGLVVLIWTKMDTSTSHSSSLSFIPSVQSSSKPEPSRGSSGKHSGRRRIRIISKMLA